MSAGGTPQNRDSLPSLYRDVIRHHAAEPTGYRQAIEATHSHETYNALCGDRIEVRFHLEGETVRAAAFDGEACAICLASASLLCGLAPGKEVTDVRQLSAVLAEVLRSPVRARLARDRDDSPGDSDRAQGALLQDNADALPQELHPLLGVRPYPSRVRCATLPWEAAVQALESGAAQET